jgi:O-methyltransferase
MRVFDHGDLERVRRELTKSSTARFDAWKDCLTAIEQQAIAGDIVEAGVWRGGNIIAARLLCPTRTCWLYDTFDGMTAPTEFDRKPNGARAMLSYLAKTAARKWACVPLDQVCGYFADAGVLDQEHLRFVVGPVEQTLRDPANIPERIALLRLDTDWHASTKIELEALYPRLAVGGFLLIDDFGHWLGCQKAVVDYFRGRPFHPKTIDDTAILLRKDEP